MTRIAQGEAIDPAGDPLRPGPITQNITLVVRAVQLDEVVVSGTAGRQERRAQSADVASIDASRLAEVAPVTNVSQLLTARTPRGAISA